MQSLFSDRNWLCLGGGGERETQREREVVGRGLTIRRVASAAQQRPEFVCIYNLPKCSIKQTLNAKREK